MFGSNKAVLEAANAAVSAGDNEGFLAHCTDDIRWTTMGEGTLQGKQAVREWMKEAYAVPPRFKVRQMVAEADHVVAIGSIMGDGPDGKPTEFAYSDVWRFRDGKMCELDAFVVKSAHAQAR